MEIYVTRRTFLASTIRTVPVLGVCTFSSEYLSGVNEIEIVLLAALFARTSAQWWSAECSLSRSHQKSTRSVYYLLKYKFGFVVVFLVEPDLILRENILYI